MAFSLLLALLALVFVLIYGKQDSFLIINQSHNPQFDLLFRNLTQLGEGFLWVPVFGYALLWRREFILPAIFSVILCFLLTQGAKHLLFPGALRPVSLLTDEARVIEGLFINRRNSFPSGHTSTAFTMALMMSYLARRHFWSFFFPLVAFFVGYSRVYLAQHFVTDVCAGVLVGVISSFLALVLYERFLQFRKKAPRKHPSAKRGPSDYETVLNSENKKGRKEHKG